MLRGRPITFYTPSDFKDSFEIEKEENAPNEQLKLEWVYGYRGKDCRCNLYVLPTGEIAYFIAAVAILYNVDEQVQRHYIGHTDDIKSMAVHPNKLIVATGQCAGHDRKNSSVIYISNSFSPCTHK